MNNEGCASGSRSPSNAFHQGDYASAALHGNPADWQTHAARGLIGMPERALAELAKVSHADAKLHEAAIRWIDGQDAQALQILDKLDSPHAKNFKSLARRSKIRVLAQCDRGSQWDLISAIQSDSKFEVVNIGFAANDRPVRPYADIRSFFDHQNPPDFYIAKMLEWHLLPPNLQSLPCPIFGHTADYDLHIQAVQPWLGVFDELLTTDQTEWRDVSQLTQNPVSVFPKAFSLALQLPELNRGIRPLDVFISGTTQHPYHPDKARLIHQILRRSDLRVKFLDGFLGMQEYLTILASVRAAFTYIRHPGGMPTRGMESLAMGAAIAVQKESILRAYLGEDEGVVAYSLEDGDLPDVLHRISTEWSEFSERARVGAEFVRREFTSARTASQYFRFLTFLAAKPRAKRVEVDPRLLRQKRSILHKGWSWRPTVNRGVRQKSLAAWAEDAKSNPTPEILINMARELVLEFATSAYMPAAQTYAKNYNARPTIERPVLLEALRLYRAGMKRFPKSLVLRFNAIRAALHFGEPEEVSEALGWAVETLTQPTGGWKISPSEDVFPWDFFGQFFNYREYFDLCTRAFQSGEDLTADLGRLILASIAYYLSFYPAENWSLGVFALKDGDDVMTNPRKLALQAQRWDSAFPFYTMRCAELLLAQATKDSDKEAVEFLVRLADESMLHARASALLVQLHQEGRCDHPRYQELADRAALTVERSNQTQIGREDWETLPLRAALPVSNSVKPAVSIVGSDSRQKPIRVLYLCLEFAQWHYAKRLAYPAGLGLEEGFTANHIEVTTLPSICGISKEARVAWQDHIRRLVGQQTFDQVWVEMVHSEWDDGFWHWIAQRAPIRVGLIMESLKYDSEVYAQAPQLQQRHDHVLKRLNWVTHALCIDEQDAAELNARGTLSALWWPQTIPARCVRTLEPFPPDRRALFAGSIYGSRQDLVHHRDLSRWMTYQTQAGEAASRFPEWFDELHRRFVVWMNSGADVTLETLALHMESWRRIRIACFDLWLRGLQAGGAVVNLPSYVKSYAGRVFEAMAAGRPVVAWDIPDRPQNQALFEPGSEILLFDRDNPADLGKQLESLYNNPSKAMRMAFSSQAALLRSHTLEQRVAQVLQWIESGTVPDFHGHFEEQQVDKPRCESAALALGETVSDPQGVVRLLGQLRLAQGDREGGFQCFEKLSRAPKISIEAATAWSRESLQAGDLGTALTAIEKAIELDPSHGEAVRSLAAVCLRSGQAELCRKLAPALDRLGADDLEFQVESVIAWALSGEFRDSVLPSEEDRRRLEPLVERVVHQLCSVHRQTNRSNREVLEPLGDLSSARACAEREEWESCWGSTLEAIRIRPFHPEAWLLLGRIAVAVGGIAQAQRITESLKKWVPKWKPLKEFAQTIPKKSAQQGPGWLCLPEWAEAALQGQRLSVCLIVRNEERFLPQCLKSIEGLAKQVIVVDTGSSDRTLEIAKSLGAEVYSFPWCDDFAAARNEALRYATGDWILVLDADEELPSSSHEPLRKLMRAEGVIAWRLPLADVGKEKEGFHHVPRLFRNVPGACFAGRIHEHAFGSLHAVMQSWGMETRIGNAALKHHGYSDQVVKDRSKVQRNLKLLSLALDEQPNDVSLRMSYGLDLIRSGQLEAGLDEYATAFKLMAAQPVAATPAELRERLLTLMASHLIVAQRFQTVVDLAATPSAQAAGPTASLHMLFGVANYMQKRFADAVKHFKQCISKRGETCLSPVLTDVQTGGPRHMLALCYVQLSKPEEAEREYRACIKEDPKLVRAGMDFARFLEQTGRWVPALEELHRIIGVAPGEITAWRQGAELALKKPEFVDFAVDWTAEAVKHFPRDPSLGIARAEALLLKGETAEAAGYWARFQDSKQPAHVAALYLCRALNGERCDPLEPRFEHIVSHELCQWFRKWVQWGAELPVRRLLESLPALESVLPSAVQTLQAVAKEADAA